MAGSEKVNAVLTPFSFATCRALIAALRETSEVTK